MRGPEAAEQKCSCELRGALLGMRCAKNCGSFSQAIRTPKRMSFRELWASYDLSFNSEPHLLSDSWRSRSVCSSPRRTVANLPQCYRLGYGRKTRKNPSISPEKLPVGPTF